MRARKDNLPPRASRGFGPVRPEEAVLLAVFESTKRDPITQRILPEAFTPKRLKDYDLSLARRAHTGRPEFDQHVVGPKIALGDQLVDVATARSRRFFEMTFVCEEIKPPVQGRAVCLLDIVEPTDHDGHAALGYSEDQSALSEKQKKKVRARIHHDLADAFGDLDPIDVIPFGT